MAETATLTIQVPVPFLEFGLDQDDLTDSVSEMLAVKMYERGRITTAAAASLLGIGRRDFLSLLRQHNVPYYDITREELERELQSLAEMRSERTA